MEEKYHKKPKDKEKDKDKKKPKMKEEVAKDTYDNPGEAAARAKEIGCTGIHTRDGKFMPCKTHDAYLEAIDKDDEKYGKPHKKPKDKTRIHGGKIVFLRDMPMVLTITK